MTKRQPGGTPVGGQFAPDRKPEGGDLAGEIKSMMDHHATVAAICDAKKGRSSLRESVLLGAEGLNDDNYYGSVLDDDHIADAKSFLSQGHTQFAHDALRRGDSDAAAKHLIAAHAAISMPDPDHGNSAQEIYAGACAALDDSTEALSADSELNSVIDSLSINESVT